MIRRAWAELRRRFAESLRLRLVMLALIPLLILLPMITGVLLWWGGASFDRVLRTKVQADLAVADGYFERVRSSIGQSVDALARSYPLVRAPGGIDQNFLQVALSGERSGFRLDFLNLLTLDGKVLASSGKLPAGSSLAGWPVVGDAREGRSSTAVDVFSAELLAQLDERLAGRADIPLLPTRNALPTDRVRESRGLVIHSAAPVFDHAGRLVALLEGGVLLNRNLDFVDRINALVYPDGSLIAGSRGTATLFLGDVRIATNVRLAGQSMESRAIGTRVSEAVRQATLDQGGTWLDRAFVVSDWFVSGYQPIIDSFGNRVGLLYIGFLEAPFMALKRESLIGVGALFGFVLLFATYLSLWGAASIFRPIARMRDTMQAVESGALDARVGELGRQDEIGRLASHFDHLLDELAARNEALTHWGRELDSKVEARTSELASANRSLEELNRSLVMTQRQLVMSEKLAAIGELTAGMAHEINNPMAVMQGNLDLIRDLMGDQLAGVGTELRLIDEQIERVRLIVSRLLQFARAGDYSGEVEPVDIASVFADCLILVSHLLKRGNIAVAQAVVTRRSVVTNRNELQQVLVNLLVNAIQAMPDGGTLTLLADDWDVAEHPAGVMLHVKDTGPGIAPELQERIFDPFFTTKRAAGTGLGLPISASLVSRYGGQITVISAPGEGAEFIVRIPLEPLEWQG